MPATEQLDLLYSSGQPVNVILDDRPDAPYMTLMRARQVVTWHGLGVNPVNRWRELYGADNAPTDAEALVRRAYQILSMGEPT